MFDSSIELIPDSLMTDNGLKSLSFFAIGSVSAVTGATVRGLISQKKEEEDPKSEEERKEERALRLGQASIEGGVLFLIYKLVSDVLVNVLPEGYNCEWYM